MAFLRCDNCGSSDTNAFGSWDTPITILCKKCSEENYRIRVDRRKLEEMRINYEDDVNGREYFGDCEL